MLLGPRRSGRVLRMASMGHELVPPTKAEQPYLVSKADLCGNESIEATGLRVGMGCA
jgi:hypothetical protein